MPFETRTYADHAATCWPKPPGVVDAVAAYLLDVGIANGRSQTARGTAAARVVSQCRTALRRRLEVPQSHQIILTSGGTDSLNLAIFGTVDAGNTIVCSDLDHSAVLRPAGIAGQVSRVPLNADGVIDLAAWERAIRVARPQLACITHASNVTGIIQPVHELSEIARHHGANVLIDACQTAGAIGLATAFDDADLVAMSGHKKLGGPLGVGVLIVGPNASLRPIRFGGTGESSSGLDPAVTQFEPGSQNVPAIAGLLAALESDASVTLEISTLDEVLAGSGFEDVVETSAERLPIRCFNVAGMSAQDVAVVLDSEFGVETRAGLHCAPQLHQSMKTDSRGGMVRVSFGPTSSQLDVERVAAALQDLTE